MKESIGKTENAPIVKVGHTYGDSYGVEPMAQGKGVAATKPVDQNFKG